MQFLRKLFLLAALACALSARAQTAPAAAPAPAALDELPPVDEAAKDASFRRFRDRLRQAIKTRDRKFILESIAPAIVNGHDLPPGRDSFIRQWFSDERDSPLWGTLGPLLELGGAFEPTDEGDPEFWAPYIYSEFPEDRAGLDEAVALGPAVAVHRKPELTAPVISRVHYAIVKVADFKPIREGETPGARLWLKVLNPDGSDGYILKSELRTPSDYRACFRKIKGQWRLTLLLTGE